MLRLVPFNDAWIQHDKIDIHAIYRRPRFVEDQYGELIREHDNNGVPTWDTTTPLPVRHHNRWRAKGFEYITLANREALVVAARYGTLPQGTTMKDFEQDQRTGGPWNYKKYAQGQETAISEEAEQLRLDVEEFGSEAVERLRRRTDPDFVLPEKLRGQAPKTRQAPAEPAPKKRTEAGA